MNARDKLLISLALGVILIRKKVKLQSKSQNHVTNVEIDMNDIRSRLSNGICLPACHDLFVLFLSCKHCQCQEHSIPCCGHIGSFLNAFSYSDDVLLSALKVDLSKQMGMHITRTTSDFIETMVFTMRRICDQAMVTGQFANDLHRKINIFSAQLVLEFLFSAHGLIAGGRHIQSEEGLLAHERIGLLSHLVLCNCRSFSKAVSGSCHELESVIRMLGTR